MRGEDPGLGSAKCEVPAFAGMTLRLTERRSFNRDDGS